MQNQDNTPNSYGFSGDLEIHWGKVCGDFCVDFEKNILEGQKIHKFYVLEPDLKARGLDIKSLIPNIDIIDYKGFVKLTVENSRVQNWL